MDEGSTNGFRCQSFKCLTSNDGVAHTLSVQEVHWIMHRGRRLPFCKAAFNDWQIPVLVRKKQKEPEEEAKGVQSI